MTSLEQIIGNIPWVDLNNLTEKYWIRSAQQTVYALDGVNVNLWDAYSSIAWSVCKATFKNSPHVDVLDLTEGNFRWPRWFSLKNLPEWYSMTTVNDWIWTKVWFTCITKSFELSAYDIIAMLSSDITRYGGKPLIFTNVLDVNTLWVNINDDVFKHATLLQRWLYEVAKELKLVVFNWETAELWKFVWSENQSLPFKYNWSWSMQGVYHPDKMIVWNKIKQWDIIIALKENWFRSNWLSSVRKAFSIRFWEKWYWNESSKIYIEQVTIPSVLYDKYLNHLNWWDTQNFEKIIDVHGIIHLSWWAFKGKLLDDLLKRKNLSANLDQLWELPEIMRLCAEWRQMNDEEIYETWNWWQWMIMIVDPNDVDKSLEQAKKFWINVKVAGHITQGDWSPQVTIKSALSWKEIIYR